MSMELPEEVDNATAILDIAQNSTLDHIKECGPKILGTLILTVYENDTGEPSASSSVDGNIFAIIGATEMWLLHEKRIR